MSNNLERYVNSIFDTSKYSFCKKHLNRHIIYEADGKKEKKTYTIKNDGTTRNPGISRKNTNFTEEYEKT